LNQCVIRWSTAPRDWNEAPLGTSTHVKGCLLIDIMLTVACQAFWIGFVDFDDVIC
jgi:hypothetical protein